MSAHAKHNLINTDQKEEKDQNQIRSIDNVICHVTKKNYLLING